MLKMRYMKIGLYKLFRKEIMSIIKYKTPMYNLLQREEFLTPFDRIFDEFFKANVPNFTQDFGVDFFEKGSYPKVDITDYNDRVVIEAEVPGLSKEDVNVETLENILVISGTKRKKEHKDESGKLVYKELKHSSFRRSFTLAENLAKDNIDAKFENGILTVTLFKIKPSYEKQVTKKIPIK